jgi:hypothetical protein
MINNEFFIVLGVNNVTVFQNTGKYEQRSGFELNSELNRYFCMFYAICSVSFRFIQPLILYHCFKTKFFCASEYVYFSKSHGFHCSEVTNETNLTFSFLI